MKSINQFVAFFVITFLLAACATTSHNGRPGWIDNPPKSSGLVAIGSASYDIFGESKARSNAINKAMAELAIQKGSSVDVVGEVSNRQTVSGSNVSEHASITTHATVRGQQIAINARIQEYWKDTETKKVWVLMVEE